MQSLSVKYRPNTFEELVSQESTVKILKKQIESNNIKNCLLFSGASGCGKTTAARIYANMINNNIGTPIEIDAASNNGVDNVRNIIASAAERSVEGKYKVYIIDECHILTIQAWNAFLKCIEEPPEYTVFIFCTTDPQKIPDTILNRVQKYHFTRIPANRIKNRLQYICEQERFINYVDSIDYISKICHGSMRDGIAILEKCADFSMDLSIENVMQVLGSFSYKDLFTIMNAIIDGDINVILECLNHVYVSGMDLKLFVEQFLDFVLDILKYSSLGSMEILKIPASMEEDICKVINFSNVSEYYGYIINKLLSLKNMIKTDTEMKSTIEVMFLQMAWCK